MIEPETEPAKRQPEMALQRYAHDAMACTFELLLVEQDAAYAEQVAQAAFAEVDRLEQELSRFVPTSDIARINALTAGQSTRVGIEALECLQLAAQLYDETGGAFDVTYASRGGAAGPGTDRPDARPLCPTASLELDAKGHCVRTRADGVRVDLGGMGKGYVIDQIVAILRDWSVAAALIHSGQSTVFALGRPAGTQGWSVGVRDPLNHEATLERIQLSGAALSGSGRSLHGDHIIDPRSGRAVVDRLGAWALAPSAALADALSTAFMVMAQEEVAEYCRQHTEVSGLLYADTPDGPRLTRFGRNLLKPRGRERGAP